MKIPCLLPLLASTSAFVPNTIMFKHPATTQLYMMYDRVEEAISDAQRICAQSGQCLATTEKLSDLGLRDHSIAELHQKAYEMKEAIWNARQAMGQ